MYANTIKSHFGPLKQKDGEICYTDYTKVPVNSLVSTVELINNSVIIH